jgi:hypothetical protein
VCHDGVRRMLERLLKRLQPVMRFRDAEAGDAQGRRVDFAVVSILLDEQDARPV